MFKTLRQSLVEYLRTNVASYFFITLIFIIGVVAGALAVKTLPENQKSELVSYLDTFFQVIVKGNDVNFHGGTLLVDVLYHNVKTIGLMWLLGFTIVGVPFVLFIVFTRGFIIGFSVGFIVNEYVFKGLVFALAAVLPHNFFAVPAVIGTGVSATSFSLMLVQRKIKTKSSLLSEAIGYTVLCLIMMGILVIASLVEVYVSPLFMRGMAMLIMK